MAICPECLSTKPFFARRCHACNEEIGFWRQTFAMYVYFGTVLLWFWFVVSSFISMSLQWQILGIWLSWILIPLVILFVIFFIYYSIRG